MINHTSTGKGGIPGSRSNMQPGIEKVTALVLTAVLAVVGIDRGQTKTRLARSNKVHPGCGVIFRFSHQVIFVRYRHFHSKNFFSLTQLLTKTREQSRISF